MAFRYEFRCTNSDCTGMLETGTQTLTETCPFCYSLMKRVWKPFHMKPVIIEPAFNPSLGKFVRSEKDMKDKFRQASDSASEQLGMDVNYVPVDASEPASVNVTDEGLSSDKLRTYESRAK